MRILVFGYGYAARALARRLAPQGWQVAATVRDDADIDRLAAEGVDAIPLDQGDRLAEALAAADALLITAPPGPQGCPALPALVPAIARAGAFPDWIGYLSTTGVYGDRRGGWVFEASRLSAQSVEGARRVAAERDWLEVGCGMGLTVTVFRLPGIYGPGRSVLDRLRAGEARSIIAPGQVFSRIHVDDLAAGLEASMARPRAGGIYNLCDDAPAPNGEVVAYAAGLLGVAPPPEVALADAGLSPAAQRFYAESKRVSNARAKAELGWRPAYPTYREGLRAVLDGGG
ncbi:MAG: Nucleoside-diphosphate-sugar epimerase [Phenylobacterium sp.]|nr:Nucleoside-diphosphate-sugar epimerase [Phenylobacterium sp.]